MDRRHKSSFEPNPLVDIEIPTLMITKADAYKCFYYGAAIGLGILCLVSIWFNQ